MFIFDAESEHSAQQQKTTEYQHVMNTQSSSNSWRVWTLGESLTKITSASLQKMIGLSSSTGVGVALGTFVIGLVQVMFGWFMRAKSGKSVWDTKRHILFSCLFGAFAFMSTMFGLTAYRLGGEVSVVVFIITLSIIPGAIIDTVFFKHRLSTRQWFGVLIGIVGAYLVLGMPGLSAAAKFPTWALFALGITFTVAINQGFTQRIKGIDPMVKNFWGGLTTAVLALCTFAFVGLPSFSDPGFSRVVIFSGAIGLVVIVMWTCNVNAYKDGAHIAEKKLMMNGLYLTFAMIVGVLFYKETFTIWKGLGIPAFIVASCLFDSKLWESFRGLSQKK